MAQWEYLIELVQITPTGFYQDFTPKVVERLNELGERRLDYVELRKLAKIYRKPVSFFGAPPE